MWEFDLTVNYYVWAKCQDAEALLLGRATELRCVTWNSLNYLRGLQHNFLMWGTKSGPPNLEGIRKANAFMHDLALQEPPYIGRRFSWTNGQPDPIWVILDRFLVNCVCANIFPKMIQNSLPRLGSDHVPILLEVGNHISNLRPFRFELVWFTLEGFQELVEHWWTELSPQGCGTFILANKSGRA